MRRYVSVFKTCKMAFFVAIFTSIMFSVVFFRITLITYGTIAWQDFKAPENCNRFIGFTWDPILQERDVLNHLIYKTPLSMLDSYLAPRVIIFTLFSLSYISMYLLTFRLARNHFLSIIISLIYAYNPITAIRIGHVALMMMYSFIPLAVYILMETLDKISQRTLLAILPSIILLALVLSLMSASVRFVLWAQPLIAVWISYLVMQHNKRLFVYKTLKLVIVLLPVYTALNALWILPTVVQVLKEGISALQAQKVIHYVLNYEVIDLLSRHASLLNVFSLTSYWMHRYGLGYVYENLLPLVKICVLIIVMSLPLSLLIIRNKTRKIFAITILLFTIITWFLAKGSNPPLKSFYYWFVFDAPLSSVLGWMFRGPNKWNLLLPFYYCFLLSLMLSELLERVKGKTLYEKIVFLILLAIILPIISPFFTGDLNGALKPVTVNPLLLNHDKAVIIYEEHPGINTQLKTLCIPSYYKASWLRLFVTESLHNQLAIAYLLSNIGIKYIVKVMRHNLSLYEINVMKQLYSPSYTSFLTDYRKVTSITNISNSIAVFLPLGSYEAKSLYARADYIMDTDSRDFLIFNPNQHSAIVVPLYNYALHHRPNEYWSRASTTDPLHGEWHPYLKKLNIENWQFDHGYGLIFTWARLRILADTHPTDKDLIEVWTFDKQDDCSLWRRYIPSKQFNALQNQVCYDGILEVRLYNSTWGWKTVKSPLIAVDPDHAYRFVIRIRGINAHKVHIKIAEFDSSRKLIDVKYVKGVGDGTFEWKEVVFNYIPSSNSVRYVQLQIWHGHLTDKPLPNIIMVDYVKVYDVTKYAKRVTLGLPFDAPRSGEYKIFVRYFENQKGGAIRIYLDNRLIAEVNTVSQLNRFVWRDLGISRLEAGKHVITLENIEGFNAVNVFVLIPVEEYDKLVKEFEKLLENKTIIYLFEAESDMFRTKAKVVKDINASNGEMLYLKTGEYAWQRFEIVRNGYYMMAVRLNGSARIVIDNSSFIVSSSAPRFYYLGPIYLEKGEHTIRVEALKKPLYLDVVWIYSVRSPSSRMTIEDLFKVKENPAKVIHHERIDPTLWRVEVVAKKPFMLVFAEAYDPLWEARVYKEGRLIEKVRSIPVYGVINGFWINATGNLTIVIRYVPQDWFELGLKISATTFALCIFYLVWEWRRCKGDRWAQWLESMLRGVIKRSSRF